MDIPTWFRALEACRVASEGGSHTFLASQVTEVLRPTAGTKATPAQITSAWLSKLCRWGYVKRNGSERVSGKRWIGIYEMTPYGMKVEIVNKGLATRPELQRLLGAVYEFSERRGGPREQEAYTFLITVANEIMPTVEPKKRSPRSRKGGRG